jgi:hypothetical protein
MDRENAVSADFLLGFCLLWRKLEEADAQLRAGSMSPVRGASR